MKILFIAPRYHTNQFPIVSILKSKKHEIKFLVERRQFSESYRNIDPVVLRPEYSLKFLVNLKKSIFEFTPDLVIIRFHNRYYSYLSAIFASIAGAKIIFYQQADIKLDFIIGFSLRKFLRKIEFWLRIFFFRSVWFTPINNFNSKNKSKFIKYLPFTFIKKKILPYKTKKSKKFTILTIGKFVERKNHLLFCKAVNKIKNKINIKAYIVGEVSTPEHMRQYRKLENFIKKQNLGKIILLKKNINFAKISSFYRKADFFVLASTKEPAAISVIEALSYCKPVLLSNTSGTRGYVGNGNCGLFFKDNSQNDLEKNLIKMCNIKNINFFIKNIKNIFYKKYDQNAYYKKFSKIAYE